MTSGYSIRTMAATEIEMAADWAAKEGWNPGLSDSNCFAQVDPQGFLLCTLDGQPAATLSTVNYDDQFAFLGFYIVRPDLRGQGLGWRIWQAGMAHAGDRTVGLDGVLAQQDNYRKSGFVLAHRNIRYGGQLQAKGVAATDILRLSEIPFGELAAQDAEIFPADRQAFLRCWISTPGHQALGLAQGSRLAAWGVIRPCRSGYKVGPLVADDLPAAQRLMDALVDSVGGGLVFLDVPEPNSAALSLAAGLGLSPVFETARMYTGSIRPIALGRVFGITSFELG